MGLFDIFKKEKEPPKRSLGDLTLDKMKPGDFVDYDLISWEVEACHAYDWGNNEKSHEWQLNSSGETVYLQKESDDDDEWSLNRKIHFNRLDPTVKDKILASGDPPDEIVFEETTYYLSETAGGHYYKDGQEPGREMLSWSYEDDAGEKYLTIEQWGEADFEASLGIAVEPYMFSNILPGAR